MALVIAHLAKGQFYFSLQYYQDSIRFSGIRANEYDASDILNTRDEFIRLKAEIPINKNYRLSAWLDLNSGLEGQSGRIGLQRWFGKYVAVEGSAKYLSYWIPYLDSMPISGEYDYDYYYGIVALGIAPTFSYQWKIFSFQAAVEYSRAFTGEKELDYLFTGPGNYRSLDRYEFQLRNYQSLYGKSQVVIDVISTRSFSIGLLYQVILRNDFFQFDYNQRRWEWTYDNLVETNEGAFRQSSHGIQHHFGIRVSLIGRE